jgi:hypothetical protein
MSRPTKPLTPAAVANIAAARDHHAEVAALERRLAHERERLHSAIMGARGAGASFAAIARGMGITAQAVSQAVKRRQR